MILLFVVLGCMMGVITGLTPGFHINLVSVILLGLSPVLLNYTDVVSLCAFIISMSITHTFTDFISATYLGAPSDDTAMAMLPAHRMLFDGVGHEAVKLTVVGSLLCLILTILISPLLIFIVPLIFEALKDYVGWLLLAIIVFMIAREPNNHKRLWSLIVVCLSGVMGIFVLTMPNLSDPLLPMLSGLFGISVLLMSISEKTRIPKQKTDVTVVVEKKETLKALLSGIVSGSIVSIFPGLGPAQAAVLASQISGKIKENAYLILVGGINTVSMILSLITLFTIEKARNGSIVVVQNLMQIIDLKILLLFFAIALLSGGIATVFTLYASRIFSSLMNVINYKMLSISIILFVCFLVLFFSGIIGFVILVTATAIGFIPNIKNVSRSSAMGCLLVPIILFSIL